MHSNIQANDGAGLTGENFEFKTLAEDVAQLLSSGGVPVIPYHSALLPVFSNLNADRKKFSLNQLSFYKKSLEMAQEGRSINEKQSLWTSIKLLGLRPTSDILNLVTSEDSVEGYDITGIQFWRNFKFMEVCSYTLEEMFSIPWPERYERDLEASKLTYEVQKKINSGRLEETYDCDIHNIIVETCSEKRNIIDAHHRHISPLYDDSNNVAGYIVISKVQLLGMREPTLPTVGFFESNFN